MSKDDDERFESRPRLQLRSVDTTAKLLSTTYVSGTVHRRMHPRSCADDTKGPVPPYAAAERVLTFQLVDTGKELGGPAYARG